ncbi:hypothetical protein [Ralstonia solanacearum]|uniref:hypothetical protein n=1 Tax=Ralstonia solanacearum TaxID=305 RepID=UPI001FFCAC09|nr:hypothetical protein [Ralstonia solanacearum]
MNNFPKALGEQARALAEASGWPIDMRSESDEAEVRYENTFTCVLRGVPLTPTTIRALTCRAPSR